MSLDGHLPGKAGAGPAGALALRESTLDFNVA